MPTAEDAEGAEEDPEGGFSGSGLSEQAQECGLFESWKHGFQILVPHVPCNRFTEHRAEVSSSMACFK